jgi:hypothetical protein
LSCSIHQTPPLPQQKLDNGIFTDADKSNNKWGKSATPDFDNTKVKTEDLNKFLYRLVSSPNEITW